MGTVSEADAAKKRRQQGHRERVRQSVENNPELDFLSDVGVLEYLLMYGIPRKDTKQIAYELTENYGSLYGICSQTSAALRSVKGMTTGAAVFLRALPAITRRLEAARLRSDTYVNNFDQTLAALLPLFSVRGDEICAVACLDARNRLINVGIVTRGASASVEMDVKAIVRRADIEGVDGIILAHNHPSDTLLPSGEDINATVQLVQTLFSMGILVKDHLIIGSNKFFSMRNAGYLEKIYERCGYVNRAFEQPPLRENLAEPIPYSERVTQYYACADENGNIVARPEEVARGKSAEGARLRSADVEEYLYRTIVRDVKRDSELDRISEQIRDFGKKIK